VVLVVVAAAAAAVVVVVVLDVIALPIVEDSLLPLLPEHAKSPHEEEVLVRVVKYHLEEEVLVPDARYPPLEADSLLHIPISALATSSTEEKAHLLAKEIPTIERVPTNPRIPSRSLLPPENKLPSSQLRPTFASQTLTQSDL